MTAVLPGAFAPALRSRKLALGLLASLALLGCSAEPDVSQSDDGVEREEDAGRPSRSDGGVRDARTTKPDEPEDDDDDGTTSPQKNEECAAIRKDAPPGKGAVDVVFLVDTSGSMLHAITQVQANLAKFVQSFEQTSADTRVAMITGLDPAAGSSIAGDAERYKFIPSPVDSKALFTIAIARFNDYKDFLRPNAVTQFVMVTDDNDLIPPAAFKDEMEKLLGHSFIQHAIASESVNGLPCISEAQLWNPLCVAPIPAVCAAAAVGEAYYSLAEQTQGEKMSICKADWTTVFEQLKKAVVEAVPLPCEYPLAEADDEFNPEEVSIVYEGSDKKEQSFPKALTPDRCGDKLGWHYDDNDKPSKIVLCPTACTKVQSGGSIDIALGCPPMIYL
jgi:hypothetical protein